MLRVVERWKGKKGERNVGGNVTIKYKIDQKKKSKKNWLEREREREREREILLSKEVSMTRKFLLTIMEMGYDCLISQEIHWCAFYSSSNSEKQFGMATWGDIIHHIGGKH